jgi:hypothetical protein
MRGGMQLRLLEIQLTFHNFSSKRKSAANETKPAGASAPRPPNPDAHRAIEKAIDVYLWPDEQDESVLGTS